MAPKATKQADLSAVIKRARDIMRKDAGLNGDTDRIPQIAWLLFLKAFDDLEDNREAVQEDYRPSIKEPYRWRDWAANSPGRRSGDELLVFVEGKLLPHLGGLVGTDPGETKAVLGGIFKETRNRMLSGYLLADLIDEVDKVHFTSADDIHTMAHLYESMLREMRDAAGDAGEFYTPRPVIRFVVDRVNPQPGESVMDPAVGTGGFLVEAWDHMAKLAVTATEREKLKGALRGFEKKPMPFLLGQMNMLLHGVEEPRITRGNALPFSMVEQRRSGVDVVLTNPPFGGEEEDGIKDNFPAGLRTAETSWLFLQSVMERIRNSPKGRAGVVIPNGVLFADGIGAKIKAKLLKDFNLHTVLRLPNGTFAPYTLIPTNVLFFEKGGPTKDVWFYEQPLPDGRKNYTKTKPLRFEEFEDCAAWWGGDKREGRIENSHAWKVSYEDIVTGNYNLDMHNPHKGDDLEHRPPAELVAELIEVETEILAVLEELQLSLIGNK
ncbi:MAG: SAM-dependent methyltransferase [Pseudarthrobacter sp.]|nr:SAM-dependent methyltransferase [Pseudarthrobacter sp.]